MKLAWGVLFALAACNPFRSGSLEGKIESKGTAGTWTLTSGKCISGQREAYFGALALGPDDSGVAIKAVKDPTKGWSLIVNIAETCKAGPEKSDCRAIVLTKDNCSKFDVEISNTNTTVNDVKVVEGTFDIDCVDGESYVKGKLKLDYCH
jgi:hypothetical protein